MWKWLEKLDIITSLIERFWILAVVFGAVVVGVVWAVWSLLESLPSPVVGILGLAAFCFIIWTILGLRKLKERRSIRLVPTRAFFIEVNRIEFGWRHANGAKEYFPDGSFHPSSSDGCLALTIDFIVQAWPEALLESVKLEVLNKTIPGEWTSQRVLSHHYLSVDFTIPVGSVNPGKHKVKLLGRFDGQLVQSEEQTVRFPKP